MISNSRVRKYCEHAQQCTNDGSEFKLKNGNFVNAKNRRDTEVHYTAEVGVPGKGPFRKFVGHDGIERLWISNDRNGTIVGEEVWSDEHGSVIISHEVY